MTLDQVQEWFGRKKCATKDNARYPQIPNRDRIATLSLPLLHHFLLRRKDTQGLTNQYLVTKTEERMRATLGWIWSTNKEPEHGFKLKHKSQDRDLNCYIFNHKFVVYCLRHTRSNLWPIPLNATDCIFTTIHALFSAHQLRLFVVIRYVEGANVKFTLRKESRVSHLLWIQLSIDALCQLDILFMVFAIFNGI